MKPRGPVASLGVIVMASTWTLAGVRNFPPIASPQRPALMLVIAASLFLAYRAGRRSRVDAAVAVAVAQSEANAVALAATAAESKAQAAVVMNWFTSKDDHPEGVKFLPTAGRQVGAREAGQALGLDDMPWMLDDQAGRHRSLEDSDVLDVVLEDVAAERDAELA